MYKIEQWSGSINQKSAPAREIKSNETLQLLGLAVVVLLAAWLSQIAVAMFQQGYLGDPDAINALLNLL